jgi:16S rRNA A1518/A1519 N6-dimethyltransferase RsmA/KsgA/DIM1 with predicted DNA glycosylase/AP lyase activity
VAYLYDEVRPGYPEHLFDDLASLSGTGPGAKVLEIGCGTGQATLPLAPRGYRVLCVELGANLAAIAQAKLADHPDSRVLTSSFEEWPLEKGARPRRLGHGVPLGRSSGPLPKERSSPAV